MLQLTQMQLDLLAKASFFRYLALRLAVTEGKPIQLSGPQRDVLWQVAQDAAAYGITSLEGCLVLVHIHFEMGLDCIQNYEAFQTVLSDSKASEREKIDALWTIRSGLFATLLGA
ncbi:MAG: hypothetical protein WCK17_07525 [Verrucomicrobiota bacterium]